MYTPYSIPISVKGIVFENQKVWIRENERKEWELPGGKLEEGEQPNQAVIRELEEELGLKCKDTMLINAQVLKINTSIDEANGVLILIYLCKKIKRTNLFETQSEAGQTEFKLIEIKELGNLNIFLLYKQAIEKASLMNQNNRE